MQVIGFNKNYDFFHILGMKQIAIFKSHSNNKKTAIIKAKARE